MRRVSFRTKPFEKKPLNAPENWQPSEPKFPLDGHFHQWASAYEEFENGAGNYTVALVETIDGEIHEVHPSWLKFDEPYVLQPAFDLAPVTANFGPK